MSSTVGFNHIIAHTATCTVCCICGGHIIVYNNILNSKTHCLIRFQVDKNRAARNCRIRGVECHTVSLVSFNRTSISSSFEDFAVLRVMPGESLTAEQFNSAAVGVVPNNRTDTCHIMSFIGNSFQESVDRILILAFICNNAVLTDNYRDTLINEVLLQVSEVAGNLCFVGICTPCGVVAP